jgi:hypothetical protein
MFYQAKPTFRHRHRGDGVIDSVCCECLVTVASARIDYGLIQSEETHVCDPVRLYQLFADPSRRSIAASADQSHERRPQRFRTHSYARRGGTMADGQTLYPHRQNEDGTFDSICPKCFLTIAKSRAEIGLAESETAHVCASSLYEGHGHFNGASS